MSPETIQYKERVVELLRKTASGHRSLAGDYKIKGHHEEARRWSKVAEALGTVANRIERGEADGESA